MGESRAFRLSRLCWRYLFSRFVSKQVFSARVSLTSVFGMGTGGPSPQSTPTYFFLKEKVSKKNFVLVLWATLWETEHFENPFGIFCSFLTEDTLSSQRPANTLRLSSFFFFKKSF